MLRSLWLYCAFLSVLAFFGCQDTTVVNFSEDRGMGSETGVVDSQMTDVFTPLDSSLPDAHVPDSNLLPVDLGAMSMDADVDAVADGDMSAQSGPFTTEQVDELFVRGCGSCHNSTASPPLNNGVSAWINRASGQSLLRLIAPGNHVQSYLYHKLADTHSLPPANGRGTGMPMGRQLYQPVTLDRIAGWIDNL